MPLGLSAHEYTITITILEGKGMRLLGFAVDITSNNAII